MKTFIILEGQRNDAGMLTDSHLLQDLEQFAFSAAPSPFCIMVILPTQCVSISKAHSEMHF